MNEEQIDFWRGEFGDEYAQRNAGFDPGLAEKAWSTMLRSVDDTQCHSVLECGCNTGRNLLTLRRLHRTWRVGLIELHPGSYRQAVEAVRPDESYNGRVTESHFAPASFDLVFTCGVLIHIHPDDLLDNCRKIYECSARYVLLAEYFNRTPVGIDYRGEPDKLFKRDFGGFFLDRFAAICRDYGFLWGREFDRGGFDDVTWWLFEKGE